MRAVVNGVSVDYPDTAPGQQTASAASAGLATVPYHPPTLALMSKTILSSGAAVSLAAGKRGFSILRTDLGLGGAERVAFCGKPVPTGSAWETTVILRPSEFGSGVYHRSGFGLIDEASGKYLSLQFNTQGGNPMMSLAYYSSLTTFSADLWSCQKVIRPAFMLFRITYDGTSYSFKMSRDYGASWIVLAAPTKAAYFTATHIGLFAQSYDTIPANQYHSVACVYWDGPDFPATDTL